MSTAPTVQDLAAEASRHFERRERESGAEFVALKEGAPEWLHQLVQDAHGDMMPDDWRYQLTERCVDAIADHENADDARDGLEPSIYTHELCDWLGSSNSRYSYCDEARAEGLVSDDASMIDRMQAGQLQELGEVFGLVLDALTARVEELEQGDDDSDPADLII